MSNINLNHDDCRVLVRALRHEAAGLRDLGAGESYSPEFRLSMAKDAERCERLRRSVERMMPDAPSEASGEVPA
jgi:hypothetical protein